MRFVKIYLNRMGRVGVLMLVLLSGSVLSMSCGGAGSSQEVVRIFAAASLEDVLQDRLRAVRKEHSFRIRVSTAGSQVVARQVMRGAPADIVFLANRRWMKRVREKGLLDANFHREVLGNRLVLISGRDSPPVRSFQELGTYDGRLAMGNPQSVPAGIYARRALVSAGLWNRFSDRVVSFPHVRAALSAVASGQVPLGMTYRTDTHRARSVQVVDTVPPEHTPEIRYPIALTTNPSPEARLVYKQLTGPEAFSVYRAHGFTVLDGDHE